MQCWSRFASIQSEEDLRVENKACDFCYFKGVQYSEGARICMRYAYAVEDGGTHRSRRCLYVIQRKIDIFII